MFKNTLEIKGIICGFFAVVLWSLLPLLRQATALIPPMQLAAMSLGIAACISTLCWLPRKVHPLEYIQLPVSAWIGAVGGLIGALFFYFLALVQAPAAEVTLITYIWPLVFALTAEILNGQTPRLETLIGASIAFSGAGLLILESSGAHMPLEHLIGYLAGIGSGACWVLYSLVMRKYKAITGPVFPWIFAVSALVGFILHMLWESTLLNLNLPVLIAAVGIGCGPYGLAFIAWSFGVRVGPPGIIGSMAYATPVLSTLFLVLLGNEQAEWQLGVAALTIVLGAAIAGKKRRSPKDGT